MKRLNNSKMWGIALVAALMAAPAWSVDLKIAVVDYGRLVEESPQAKVALDAIRTEFTPRQKEMQQQEVSLKSKQDRLEKDAATMSEEQRTRSEKDLRDGARDLARRRQEVQDDFNARRNEEMSRLQRTLIEEVRTYAKAQGFDLVIADGVIYSVPTLDITPAILSSLQARAPKAAAGSAAPPAGAKPAPPAK
ncbi:MAG: OmpH family outer membrane protein [Gammaproteobacteria bacterium]